VNIIQLFDQLKKSLDDLEAAIKLLDITPQVVELDTRIQALTGLVKAMVTTP